MLEDVTAPWLTSEWGRYLGLFVMILFGALLADTLVKTPLHWQSDYILTHGIRDKTVTPPLMDQATTLIKYIPQQHLLGNTDTTQTLLPITQLPFALLGIMESKANKVSHVIISEAGQTGKIYQIGNTLSSDIKLSEIRADGIIVNNKGHLEKLPLQRTPVIFQEIPKKSF